MRPRPGGGRRLTGLLGVMSWACSPTVPCGEGTVRAESGGCVVDVGAPCPEGQIKDLDGACIEPFFESTRDSGVATHTGAPPPDDTDSGRGDPCAWVVVTTVGDGPDEVAWQLRDEEREDVVVSAAPGTFTTAGPHRADPVTLYEGVQYAMRLVDLGGDGWGQGASVRVELAADPLRVAMSNTLAAGPEGTFPFNVLCPAR